MLLLIFLLLLSSSFCTDCVAADIGISFGVCNTSTNLRDVVFYLKNNCTQTNTAKLPTPPVWTNVNCSGLCYDGQRLDITKNCAENPRVCCAGCPNGSQGVSVDHEFVEWTANKWPPNFSSTSAYPWRVDDAGITTGALPPNTTSTLTIEMDVSNTTGYLDFEIIGYYTGYGTSYEFLIDGIPTPTFGSQTELVWGNVTYLYYLIPFGSHNISIVYHSNQNDFVDVEGARITYVWMLGVNYETTNCKQCLAGQESIHGGMCSYCRDNQYNDAPGGYCKNCSSNEYSLPGATRCEAKRPCEVKDYHMEYSSCDSNRESTLTYSLFYPLICDNTTVPVEISSKNNTKSPCLNCNPGTIYDPDNEKCVACPAGTHRENIDGPNICTPCPPGTTTFKTLYIKTLKDTDKNLYSTYCYRYGLTASACTGGGDGWGTTNNTITSGNYYLGAVTSSLHFFVPGYDPPKNTSKIEFRFRLHLQPGSLFTYFSGRAGTPKQYNSTDNGEWIDESMPYMPSSYRDSIFTWSFHGRQKTGINMETGERLSDYVEIDHIIFHDVPDDTATGGAVSCTQV